MADYKYSFKEFDAEHMARCVGKDLPISTKHCVEICNFIRHKNLQKAKELLERISKKDMPLKFRRHNKKVGHKPGIGPGRYPVKACVEINKLLDSVENNAVFKGLDSGSLVIKHISSQRASRPMKYSRRIRGESKRTHVEIVVEESFKEKKEKEKKDVKKKETNKENKKEKPQVQMKAEEKK
ncbi:50S ribosomal protein L22 [Candidatus Woesearchaeota archaeon]|nr:50S ribosomal protein L22 [Candidatus Woesearchaeota archaeon]MBW3021526.1 50S ribosomal protein L22 [Candidatus Woesearchaeota archaeon]